MRHIRGFCESRLDNKKKGERAMSQNRLKNLKNMRSLSLPEGIRTSLTWKGTDNGQQYSPTFFPYG
ncbi:hypothetical protein GCM10022414_13650 [Zhongshania borealis]|uniref:Uncharacterized protein n=1 Tax=Zhongshania borealis TaxID=889488 RepID=A0ABP7WNG5_9GAMM